MGVEHRMLVLASRVTIRSPQLAGRACQFLLPPAYIPNARTGPSPQVRGGVMTGMSAVIRHDKPNGH